MQIEDISRLSKNQQSLLQAMDEMILLMSSAGEIEYMNHSARTFFGELQEQSYSKDSEISRLHNRLRDFALSAKNNTTCSHKTSCTFNGCDLEFRIAPFIGYNGDNLFWLVFNNLTNEKRCQQELGRFQQNLESILIHKINELKESERVRKSLLRQVKNFKEYLKQSRPQEGGGLVGTSSIMCNLRDMVLQIAKTDSTVLITGESGTGKELVVDMIHQTSNRNDRPLLKINCTAINDSLLESDLFGYEKGAFTGAQERKKGKFEVVDGGTIFLDEIGDISPRMQGALLRVLETGEVIRVGGNLPIRVDVRVVAATNIDPALAIKKGSFRLDLFYRLSVLNITLPPLRERKEDIPDLVSHFLDKYCRAFKKGIENISETAIEKLVQHDWPGNVRELDNVMQRAVLLSKNNILFKENIIFDSGERNTSLKKDVSLSSITRNGSSLKGMIADFEKEVLLNKLDTYHGNVLQLAEALQIGKTALYEKLKHHKIRPRSLR
ncbi:sigma-54 interaction domain-containing protein [Desulfofustis glycolicus]|uniref:Regulatory protein, Fis family n=1 Tax=Desulfofustis glycolicus DSM 9705 TaxID=1121409 RepID=A0A1M5YLF3_9BACT|nr:sigma-54 dependent transcriptional regulator [Desulfofustis glycolicus]SHI12781.1 regulatory protein, Fis family [Desulfofustis glycolicus DSM 9705]